MAAVPLPVLASVLDGVLTEGLIRADGISGQHGYESLHRLLPCGWGSGPAQRALEQRLGPALRRL
eukprot:scaffold757_cov246-Pinguiococcus_pyrenoidosus.AAC.30